VTLEDAIWHAEKGRVALGDFIKLAEEEKKRVKSADEVSMHNTTILK